MKKIPTLFQRNHEGDRLVRNEVTPGCEWVLAGEGIATRKYDGTCCLIRDGKLFKRHEVKRRGEIPYDFEPETEVDEITGKIQGWLLVGDGPEDRWHREGFENLASIGIVDGTYELCGPKVQGNPEGEERHVLIRHGLGILEGEFARCFDDIRDYLMANDYEGIVWHRENGDMCKIKKRDFIK